MIVERKIQGGFVGGLLLLAAAVLLFFHTKPANETLKKLAGEVATRKIEMAQLKPADGAGGGQTAEFSEVEQKELAAQIPERLDQHQIILELSRAANASGVSFNALTFALGSTGSLPAVNISGGFSGEAKAIGRFLKTIESGSGRKFLVRSAGVTQTQEVDGVPYVTLSATFQSFFRYAE